MKIQIKCFLRPSHRDIAVILDSPSGVMTHIEFTPVQPGAAAPDEAVLSLREEDAQILMDSLWDCGIRPAQGKGSAGQLSAVNRHLEDMRVIAFNSLEIQKPS